MGPLHWSSFFWTQKVGLGKMILTGPEFGHFVLLCSVSGMVELFMHRWGLVSHSFGSHLFLACHILRGFEARLLCLMDVDVGQRMRKVPQQYPEFFGQSPSNCQKQYFLLTFTLFLGWKIEPSSFWQSYSFPRINDPIVIEGWDCSIFFHIWYLVSSIMLAFCSLYMFVLPILVDKQRHIVSITYFKSLADYHHSCELYQFLVR